MDKSANGKILMDMRDLYAKIGELSKYYNKETSNYLYSLFLCSESVFNRLDFTEHFSELSLFYELAKYNICNKAVTSLYKLYGDKIDEFNFGEYDKGFKISYQDKFPVFDFRTSKEEVNGEEIGPIITIYSVTASLEDRKENVKNQIRNLQNSDYSNNHIEKYDDKEKAMYQAMFGSYSTKKLYLYRNRIKELGEKIEFLKKYGDVQKDICNLVTDTLIKDWGITFDNDTYLKRLSWIDIYKKRV